MHCEGGAKLSRRKGSREWEPKEGFPKSGIPLEPDGRENQTSQEAEGVCSEQGRGPTPSQRMDRAMMLGVGGRCRLWVSWEYEKAQKRTGRGGWGELQSVGAELRGSNLPQVAMVPLKALRRNPFHCNL